MTWYEKIIGCHLAVTEAVSHAKRLRSERYFVWQEEDRTDLEVNGRHAELCQNGTTDLYTKTEFDPWARQFERALDAAPGVTWRYESCQYEPDTGFWHHEWLWSVRHGDD